MAAEEILQAGTGSWSEPYGWDWTATTHEGHAGIVNELLGAVGAVKAHMGKGLQGWSKSVVGFDAGGWKVASIYFGGGRDDVHVVSTSHQAHDARTAVVRLGSARTSRVDTRVDTLIPFDELRGLCEGLGGRGTKVTYMESRVLAGDGASEAAGRTVYVGAPTSAVRVRVYEKWLESPGLYVEGTNRVEVQLRPPSRAKSIVSRWTPAETFCASRLTRRLAKELGSEIAEPESLQKQRDTPDLERTLAAMGHQYGPAVARWLSFSGGDVGRVLDYLGEGESLSREAPLLLAR